MEEEIDIKTIQAILSRGNTAEIKRNKAGVVILEVKKKITRAEESACSIAADVNNKN